ncbi:branched-chain amino acid ABC transporter permease [Gemmobacter sp.]|uniref:branched-chain amino acid ABC transporter permease n=1 Tax=Gemmobacter sp. TaxID=1898957 RepID=UPI002AFF4593|nr:branched-chain amino acid ABC transporter permease [Gemmobacter sp.]
MTASQLRNVSTPAILIASLVVLAGLSLAAGGAMPQVATEMMIRVMIVVGLYVFIGNSGVLSFAHVGFVSIGAYAAAWFTCCTLPMVKPLYLPGLPEALQQTSYPLWVGLLSAAAVSGGVAALVGILVVRLNGIAASIATFAFLAIVFAVYSNWESVTGGTASISNIPVEVGPMLATVGAAGAVLVAFAFQVSRFGLMLKASRDEGVAAKSCGINIGLVRYAAWVISAMIAGVAGAFYSSYMGILSVDAFYMHMTFLVLAMLIVGGMQSLSGAVIGTVVLTAVTEILRLLENGEGLLQLPKGLQEVGLGAVMMLILILRPKGLMNGRDLALPLRD